MEKYVIWESNLENSKDLLCVCVYIYIYIYIYVYVCVRALVYVYIIKYSRTLMI